MKTAILTIFCSCFAVSAFADGPPPKAFMKTPEERITDLEKTDVKFENRLKAVEAQLKLATPCPCADGGECTCGPDCKCPNCPKHKTNIPVPDEECKFEGKQNSFGRHIKLCSSLDCVPCLKFKKELCSAGLCENVELVMFDTLQDAAKAGYTSLPYAHFCEDGETVIRVNSTLCDVEEFTDFLENGYKPVGSPNRVVAPRGGYPIQCGPEGCYSQPSYSQPSYSCGPNGCYFTPQYQPAFRSGCANGSCGR